MNTKILALGLLSFALERSGLQEYVQAGLSSATTTEPFTK